MHLFDLCIWHAMFRRRLQNTNISFKHHHWTMQASINRLLQMAVVWQRHFSVTEKAVSCVKDAKSPNKLWPAKGKVTSYTQNHTHYLNSPCWNFDHFLVQVGSKDFTLLQVKLGITILFHEIRLTRASVASSLCINIKLWGIYPCIRGKQFMYKHKTVGHIPVHPWQAVYV